MKRAVKIICAICMASAPVAAAMGEEAQNAPRMISGMSIVGNDEAPKSLYFVPWKSAEGDGPEFTSGILRGGMEAIDREDIVRELERYRQRNQNQSAVTN